VRLEQAYQACEAITSSQARNFSWGIQLLPKPKRRAMCALYAMARRIDDVGDSDADPGDRLEQLAAIEAQLAHLASGGDPPPDDPVATALADAAARYPLPFDALAQLVAGCRADVTGRRYETFEELVCYCRSVAGTIGRLSLAIYGSQQPERARALADDLGVALQLTNILRDVMEDLQAMGRVYLPAEDLRRFGLGPNLEGDPERLVALVSFEAARAEGWYERGLGLLPLLDWRSRAATGAMAGIYRRLLERIQLDPGAVLAGRVSLPAWQKAAVAARCLGGVAA
jgi:phytoene synthase